MKGDLEFQELAGSLQAAKFELVLGLKQREGYLTKLKLGEYFIFLYLKRVSLYQHFFVVVVILYDFLTIPF